MTREEHLLVIIAEECSEIAKHCTKALRFGLDSGYPGECNNAEGIMAEFADLCAVVEMLREHSRRVEQAAQNVDMKESMRLKNAKVETFLEYSAERGRLTKLSERHDANEEQRRQIDPACYCAHMTVKYDPIDHGDGTYSSRWRCADCKWGFSPLPRLAAMEPPEEVK